MARIATGLALGLSGCTAVLKAPRAPVDPVAVYIMDHGRTPSLVLPRGRNELVRYVYGDWEYYARARNDVFRGAAALLWPTQGALGRSEIQWTDDSQEMLARFHTDVEHLHVVVVEDDAAARLLRRLDDLFQANLAWHVANEPYALEFVSHPRAYTALHNSNHVVAAWLGELGCEVHAPAIFWNWRIKRE